MSYLAINCILVTNTIDREMDDFRSYTEARKDREKFRKRLVEVIMHRDEWDDEDEEPSWAGAPLTTKEKDMLR